MTRVLVCGGRDYGVRPRNDPGSPGHAIARAQRRTFSDTMMRIVDARGADSVTVIQGGADGADALAREWCATYRVPCLSFPADWKKRGKAAGPERNARMISEGKPDRVLAFPGGKGTANMKLQALAAGIEVIEVKP